MPDSKVLDTGFDSLKNALEAEKKRALSKLKVECTRKGDFYDSKVVLYCGAGINGSSLSWSAVLEDLYQSALKRYHIENHIPYKEGGNIFFPEMLKASFVKHIFQDGYVTELSRIIYGKGKKNDIKGEFDSFEEDKVLLSDGFSGKTPASTNYFTLYVLASIILDNTNITAVVSQNYDDFLSFSVQYLQELRKVEPEKQVRCVEVWGRVYGSLMEAQFACIKGVRENPKCGRTIPIYHVHGFLPPPDKMQNNQLHNSIVMTMDEIYSLSKDQFAWSTATQLHFFSHRICIIAGLSLTDITSQRMLHYVQESGNMSQNIYYLNAVDSSSGNENALVKESIMCELHKDLSLTPILSTDGFVSLYWDVYDSMKMV